MDEQEKGPDLDKLVETLRARIAERREAGEYPAGLEEDLEHHFQRIVAHRTEPHADRLGPGLARLDEVPGFSTSRISEASQVPGGGALHRTVGRLVSRQTEGVLQQAQELADAVRPLLHDLVVAVHDPGTHLHVDLLTQIDALVERLAAYERAPLEAGDLGALAELNRRIERLEAAEARRSLRPWYRSDRFEEEFRGSRDEIIERYRGLARRLEGCSPVLDLGCGRGEFLQLLREIGVDASGVELDADAAAVARASGAKVEEEDGLDVLARLPDGSLGGLVLLQVVEHLTGQELLELVLLARDKLRAGGRIVVETVNPQSLYVFAHAFYLDPSHQAVVHPAYLSFLFREAGFGRVEVEWRSPPPEDEVMEEVPGSGELEKHLNANLARLNQLLFAPQDYALVVTR